jgi:hypothetical protein
MPTLLEASPSRTQPSISDLPRQRRLARHLRQRLSPADEAADDTAGETNDIISVDAEELRRYLAEELAEVRGLAAQAPTAADDFVDWFEHLREVGSGQGDPLFPWLAEVASAEQMRFFLQQELAGEAGFDDLISLTMVRMPPQPKMEMARNLWDEFGRGHAHGVHSMLLGRMASELGLSSPLDEALTEVLAQANLMAGLAVERHGYRCAGALGVIELTAPARVSCVAAGMRRLGMPASARRYFELHATIDVEHARRWLDEVLRPLVADNARLAPLLAQGALLRLRAGARCFARYDAIFEVT